MTGLHAAHDSQAHGGGAARTVVLVALGALLLAKWRDGALPLYVHPGFAPVLLLTGVVLMALAAVQPLTLLRAPAPEKSSDNHGISAWALALMLIVVVVGALMPARPLGSAAASTQAAELPPSSTLTLTDETESWTLLEWAQALGGGVRRERLAGRRVSVVGFVHRPRDGAASGEVLVTRFVVRCCAADGLAVSLPIRHPDVDSLASDTWIRVDGALRLAHEGDRTAFFVEADRLTVVPTPTTPYLTPT
jgi:uncharacterized repeat protein (TIGR03943 family)